jgi:hypothetical protein
MAKCSTCEKVLGPVNVNEIKSSAVRYLLVLTGVLLPTGVAWAGPIMDVLSVSYAITGTGTSYELVQGPDGSYQVPIYTVSIDATSDTPLSAFEYNLGFAMEAEASGSIDDLGGHLYTYVRQDDEGLGSAAGVSATASARFVSLVSQLELTLFGVRFDGADEQRSVALYDETLGQYVFRTWPFAPFEGEPFPGTWSGYAQPFQVTAHVGHLYTLTSYSYEPASGEAGVAITGTPVPDHGSTLVLFLGAIVALSVIRVSRRA